MMETFSPLRLTDLGGKPMAEDCSLLVAAPKLFKSGWIYSPSSPPARAKLAVGDVCKLVRKSVGKHLAFNELTLLPEYNGETIPEHHTISAGNTSAQVGASKILERQISSRE